MADRGSDAVKDGALVAVSVTDSEAAARGSMRESYRSMFESSPQPMYVLELSTLQFLEVNDAAVLQYGYTREELLTMNASALWPREDDEKNLEALSPPASARHPHAASQEGRLDLLGECACERPDLRRPPVSPGARERRDPASRDEEARRAAETRYARLRDSGIIGIVVTKLDGPVLEVNDALVDLLGYSREELVSGRVRWSDLTPHEWRSPDQRAVEQLTSAGVASLREKEYMRRTGHAFPCWSARRCWRGPGGTAFRSCSISGQQGGGGRGRAPPRGARVGGHVPRFRRSRSRRGDHRQP